jgi:hypothetical protein
LLRNNVELAVVGLWVDAPDGTLRKDGLKVVEGGKIRYGKKK